MSVVREAAVVLLLGVSAVVTALSAVGVLVMRAPLQRLHFVAAPALSAFLVAAAIAIAGAGPEAWIKALLVAVLLLLNSGVLGHAIARAVFAHARGKWPPAPGEAVPAGEQEGAS